MALDCIIIGKGPAGISTAIYLKRYGFNPIIIAKDGGALENVKEIENYYGIEFITGPELLEIGYKQAKKFNIEIVNEEVLALDKMENFQVKTNKKTYEAKTVVLASGASRNRYVKADKYEGVSYCATCDGFFYRKKKVALIGNSNYMAHELEVLENICKEVIVFTDGKKLEANINPNIRVVTEKINEIIGDERIRAIKTDKEYEIDGCFVAIGNASGFTLAKHLGIALNNNSIIVDEKYMTNIGGLFACGDCIGGLMQVSKAVGDGAICATAISAYLKGINKQ